ncbi:PD-(D/E)XK nuclease family protein [Sinorhizobium sp. 7-81]|uniref:PDDEXK-like family protein n=1 Tax=Sinorhizobium sp. 8-89 TaxID=3049089 RepID=UPI0024C3F3D2|nr:PD-(D/E)XK nuclease family protein [Sinorhizobium sp. 8-89]MDK1492465.1 PD-(D/E)XK nuclease family protein [Sinorhizobium sp. 8-89]
MISFDNTPRADGRRDKAALTTHYAFPTPKELEDLFVNNRDLQRVAAYLNRFNPIRTMRMDGMEIRHSSILAWLLDPRETHGLSDRFLRGFLCEAMRGQSALGSPTALEIAQADLRDAEVRREWQQIDIFVLLPRLNWAFVIENKFHSSQHEGQLAKYAERVKSIFEAASPQHHGLEP